MRIHRLHIIAVNKCLVKEGRIIDNNLKVMVENSRAGRNSSLYTHPKTDLNLQLDTNHVYSISQLEQMQWYIYVRVCLVSGPDTCEQ